MDRASKFALLLTLMVCTGNAIAEVNHIDIVESATDRELGFFDTLEAALAYDPQLKNAFWNYQAEQQEVKLNRSQLLPDVRLSASYQYEDSDNIYTDEDSDLFNPDLPRSGGELKDTYWQLFLRQPLLNYSAYKNYKSSQVLVEGSAQNYQRLLQEAIYRLAERYLKVLLSAQEVFLNQQKLDALNLKLTQVRRANELGVGDQLQVLHARANRDLAQSELLQAKSALVDAQTLLSHLTGFNVNYPRSWVGSSQQIAPGFLNGHQEEWLARIHNNARVKEAKLRIRRQKLDLEAVQGEFLPTIDFTLRYADRDSEDDFRTRKGTTAAIEFNMPLYSGGRTQAGIKKNEALVKANEAELDYIVKEKSQQIELSYNRLVSFEDRLNALAESRESSKRYLEAAERELSLNLSDQANVLDARTQLVDTRLEIARTLNDYLLADLILRLEAGELTQERLADYDQMFQASVEQ